MCNNFLLTKYIIFFSFSLLSLYEIYKTNMVSESFQVYHSDYLLSLSGHALSNRYRTTYNI